MHEVNTVEGRLHITGTFECRDKDGTLVKTITLTAEVPLAELEEFEKLTQGGEHGDQHR